MGNLFQAIFKRTPMARSTRAYDFGLQHVTLPDKPWILEIGTGQGYGVAHLSRTLPHAYIVSLDITLANYRREQLEFGPREPYIIQANAPYLPLAHGCMDAVLLIMTFHCLPDPQRVLEESARVLRPGGHILIADVDGRHWMARPFEWVEHAFISPYTRAYPPDRLTQMLHQAGFGQVTIHKRPGKEKGFMMWVVARKEGPAPARG